MFDPVMAAVSVTVDPRVAGEGEATSAVVDVRGFVPDDFTYCAKARDTLGGMTPLPRYVAVIACPPDASPAVVNCAVEPETDAVPISTVPS